MPPRWSILPDWPRSTRLLVALALLGSLHAWAAPRQLVIGLEADVSHFDPHYSTAASDMHVYANLYDTLVRRDAHLNLVPGLATSWRLVDATTWQFTLRDGVMFHHGAPLSAADVKFSLERAASENPRTSVYIALHPVEQVEVLDRLTLNITTTHPDPLLPARLASHGGMILPQRYFEDVGMAGFRRAPIGTGPMRFVERRQDNGVVFEAKTPTWRRVVPYTQVIYQPYPAAAARIAALLTGKVNLITAVPPDQVEAIERSGTATISGALCPEFVVFYMNVNKPPFDNKLLRQAVHYAIDRQTLVHKLWRGHGVVPNGAYPNGAILGHDGSKPRFEYAPNKAKHLLATAGYKGEVITITSPVGQFPNDQQVAEAIATMLGNVGINASVQRLGDATRIQQLRDKAIDGLWLEHQSSPLLDPDDLFWRVMQPGGLFDYWRHPQWDQLMGEAPSLPHQAMRRANYQQAAQIFLDEVPVLIVLQPEKLFALQKGLTWQARRDAVVVLDDLKPTASR